MIIKEYILFLDAFLSIYDEELFSNVSNLFLRVLEFCFPGDISTFAILLLVKFEESNKTIGSYKKTF